MNWIKKFLGFENLINKSDKIIERLDALDCSIYNTNIRLDNIEVCVKSIKDYIPYLTNGNMNDNKIDELKKVMEEALESIEFKVNAIPKEIVLKTVLSI